MLGHGGMGAVYKAQQTRLERTVALKIIRPGSADDPAFAERFNREAKTLARLNHPSIVSVYDFGEVQYDEPGAARPVTLYYFIMEFVDGANLRQLIAAGETRSVQALAIIPQICDALQYAHDQGVVHRDIKPDNILIDTTGHVKIADFGLAKLGTDQEDFTLTATHQILGTVRYMAPEQLAQSNTVDHRADIYSLGVVLYELLTGEVPAGAFEPPSRRAPVDARLDEIVMRALATDPDRRFQNASEIGSRLSDLSGTEPPNVDSETEPADWPGPSTIIDRGLGAVAAGLRGVFAPTDDADADADGDFDEGNTYVTLDRRQVEMDELPDLCMVCGKPTKRRVSHQFESAPEWATGLLVVLFIFFFPAGIVATVMLTKKVNMSCPVCTRHRRHWSNLLWFASLGWIMILVGIFAGLGFGGVFGDGEHNVGIILTGILVPTAMYVIPLVWLCMTRISVQDINDQSVVLKRVSTRFARAVRAMERHS